MGKSDTSVLEQMEELFHRFHRAEDSWTPYFPCVLSTDKFNLLLGGLETVFSLPGVAVGGMIHNAL